jgi:hypothetical protein
MMPTLDAYFRQRDFWRGNTLCRIFLIIWCLQMAETVGGRLANNGLAIFDIE